MPFIKKLIIHGFKSFANKIEIEFKEGITGVVGPNGCGKSNVFDSIKWVLGEKSSKSIRGENAKDIIFAGTEEHKPIGLAEVEVVLDNAKMTLPVKYNEVSIRRRIFRSGEAEFFINKNNVRLKDVHQLFSDTGVGKGAYSFLEQGKIDQILSSKPEERRAIFEEAAGISRYKSRKKETIDKLELTNNNLEQVNVLIRELENEKKSLKIQAEKAIQYNKNKEHQKELEIKLYGSRYRDSIEKIKEVDQKIIALTDKKTQLKTQNTSLNSEIEMINKEIFDFNETKNKFEKEKLTFEQMIKSNDDKINIYNDILNKNQNDIEQKKQQIENLQKENQKIQDKIGEVQENLKRYEIQRKETDETLNKINDESNILKDKKNHNNKQKDRFKVNIENNQTRSGELKTELRKLTDEFVAEIDKKKKEVEGNQDYQSGIKNQILNLLNDIEARLQNNLQNFNAGSLEDSIRHIQDLKKLINDFAIHQDEFKNLIFDENGAYAKKEKVDNTINRLMEEIITDQNKISALEIENEEISNNISDLFQKRNELNGTKIDIKNHINNCNKDISTFRDNLQRNSSYINNINAEIRNIETNNKKLNDDISHLKKEIDGLKKKSDEIVKKILKFEEDMNEQNEKISKRKGRIRELLIKLEQMDKSVEGQRENKYKLEGQVREYELHLYNEFNIKVEEIISSLPERINEKHITDELNQLKLEMKELGHVNLLAEELYEDVNKRYNFHIEQKEDLVKAKEDLLKIIEEVNKESEKMFTDTFKAIRENFHQIFRRLFGGGKADLVLLEQDNILESGIEISVQPPGKKINTYNWLSGGERSLVAIGLLFSIFLVKPSPFCVLDEIDAALDEHNNLKFLKLMKEFAKDTQFIVISHNQHTIANSDYLFGVTMEEKGISKIVSLELKKEKIDEFIK